MEEMEEAVGRWLPDYGGEKEGTNNLGRRKAPEAGSPISCNRGSVWALEYILEV